MKANSYVRAKSLEEAYELLKANPLNKILGGGLWLKKGNASVNVLIDLVDLGLDKIEDDGDFIKVGALVNQRDFEKSELVKEICHGILSKAASSIMGPAFRQVATIGGSVFGKYGFSDLISALLVCNASLVFYPSGEMNLEDYLKQPGFSKEILTHIIIKKCHRVSYFKKVGITALDYPIINVAITRCVNHDRYRVVVGSRAGVASFASDVMEALDNGERDFEKVAKLVSKMKFSDSLAAKADYREHLAEIYVRRGLEEVNK
jgi:CO/xanthine dehydrogenase FAD-binding subunit